MGEQRPDGERVEAAPPAADTARATTRARAPALAPRSADQATFATLLARTDDQSRADALLALQRTAGNAAVTRVLATAAAGPSSQRRPALLRQPSKPPAPAGGAAPASTTWRTGDGAVAIRSRVARPPGRLGLEKLLPASVEVNLKGWERAHSQGNITGAESGAGIRYAPPVVNQHLQRLGIEQHIADLHLQKAPSTVVYMTTETYSHEGTLRLKEIVYRVEVWKPGMSKPRIVYEASIEVANQTVNPRITVSKPESIAWQGLEEGGFLKPLPPKSASGAAPAPKGPATAGVGEVPAAAGKAAGAIKVSPGPALQAEELLTIRSFMRELVASGALKQIVKGLVINVVIGIIAALVISWAHRGILRRRLEALEPVIAQRLQEALPGGIQLALAHPTETVYACIVTRVGRPSGISLDARSGRGEGAPTAHPENVHVYFDTEPHEGELGDGVSGDFILFETWTDYGHSVPLDDLLKRGPRESYEAFLNARMRAQQAFYADHPGARPLSHVQSAPHEDPIAGR